MSSFLNPIRKLFSNGVKKIKEFGKESFFYLRVISFTFFVLFSSIPFFTTPLVKEDPSFLSYLSKAISQSSSRNPFLNPADKLLIESPDFLLVEKSSLRAATPPSLVSPQVLGVLVGEYKPEETKKEINQYIIEEGDTLLSLAAKFEISLNTILWANNLTEKSIIRPGQKLIILPISGVIYHVKSGDTLSEIARTYKGKVEEIVAFNAISSENDIYVGDILIVPAGVMPPPVAKRRPTLINVPLVDSQFILPVSSPYVITQGLHWYNAVDFSHPGYACGKPVFAAAGGTVQKIDYNRYLGNYARILHPNGVVTLYGHFSGITVKTGDEINVGAIIGYIGNTGHVRGVTGCHLHFEVRGARNPFAR